MLRSFCRAIGPQTLITDIDVEAVSAFLTRGGSVTSGWFNNGIREPLNGLFQYAIRCGDLTQAPLPTVVPKHPPPFVPYIYTADEIRQLLDAIPSSQRRPALIAPESLRAIVLVSYGAALRSGEVLALTVADVDLPKALITVRDSKFFKSRLVPIGQHELAGAC